MSKRKKETDEGIRTPLGRLPPFLLSLHPDPAAKRRQHNRTSAGMCCADKRQGLSEPSLLPKGDCKNWEAQTCRIRLRIRNGKCWRELRDTRLPRLHDRNGGRANVTVAVLGISLCVSPALTRPLDSRARGGATLPVQSGLSTVVPRTRGSGRAGGPPASSTRGARPSPPHSPVPACPRWSAQDGIQRQQTGCQCPETRVHSWARATKRGSQRTQATRHTRHF